MRNWTERKRIGEIKQTWRLVWPDVTSQSGWQINFPTSEMCMKHCITFRHPTSSIIDLPVDFIQIDRLNNYNQKENTFLGLFKRVGTTTIFGIIFRK